MKFVILESVSKENLIRLQKKVVCNVTELFAPSNIVGSYKGWLGSTEEEYFSIVFVNGILTISLEEREMCLGWRSLSYAIIDTVADAYSGKASVAKNILVQEYDLHLYLKDLNEIKFKDVMKTLKWKLKSKKVKVDEHFLNDSLLISDNKDNLLTFPEIVI